MKIFVTGGLGFIGSNFILNQIQFHKNNILNFDKMTYAANQDNLLKIEKNPLYEFKQGDIADEMDVNKAIKNFKPDCIINFAAESHVDRSIDGPKEFISTNILGTYVLLQASLEYFKIIEKSKKEKFRFLHVSTDEVYGSLKETGFFNENTAYDPSSPYSASKASSDHLVRAWGRTYNLPVLITNCSNNYGPRQFPEKLIPLIIINCLNNNKLPIYGDGKNIRDWLYVKDHCDALHIVLNNGQTGETYNIGGNEEQTNINIVNMICEILNEKVPSSKLSSYKDLIVYVKDRPGHDYRYAIDANKIKDELGWEPQYKFKEALSQTIDWYLSNKKWWGKILDNTYNLERLGKV